MPAIRVRTASGWQDVAIQGAPGPVGGSMIMLEDKLLAASAPSFDFQNIPQTYSHLKIFLVGRSDTGAGSQTWVRARFNNDSGIVYDYQSLYGVGASALAVQSIAANSIAVGLIPGGTESVDYFGQAEIMIPNYRVVSPPLRKSANGTSLKPSPNSGGLYAVLSGGAWRTANAAIDRITLFPEFGNFVAGSRATLYGISADLANPVLLPDNSVTLAKMADNSVGSAELVNASVSLAKLASDARYPRVYVGGTGVNGHVSGPWPKAIIGITLPFKADLALSWTASCYAQYGGVNGLQPTLDGSAQGFGGYYFNEVSTHKPVSGFVIIRGVAAGGHTLGMALYGSTISDSNDYCTMQVVATEVA